MAMTPMFRNVVIGKPVKHSLSPAMHTAGYLALGIDADYEFHHHALDYELLPNFAGNVRSGTINAACVTMPFKQTIIPFLDRITAEAKLAGAVNTVYRDGSKLVGHNTDGSGWLRSVQSAGVELTGIKAILIGAGGAAGPIGHALIDGGAARISIVNRTAARADRLATSLQDRDSTTEIATAGLADLPSLLTGPVLIINATPLGMSGILEDQSPVPEGLVSSEMVVSDIVYTPRVTPLLRQAQAAGARIVEGLEMFAQQGAEQFRIFTGREIKVEVLRDAVIAALEAPA